MEGVKSLYVSVACERYNGLDLSATHCVFPAVAWTTFSVHIFFFFFDVPVNDCISINYFSQVS